MLSQNFKNGRFIPSRKVSCLIFLDQFFWLSSSKIVVNMPYKFNLFVLMKLMILNASCFVAVR